MRDLLGGDHIVDLDQYLIDDDTYGNLLQNNLRNPTGRSAKATGSATTTTCQRTASRSRRLGRIPSRTAPDLPCGQNRRGRHRPPRLLRERTLPGKSLLRQVPHAAFYPLSAAGSVRLFALGPALSGTLGRHSARMPEPDDLFSTRNITTGRRTIRSRRNVTRPNWDTPGAAAISASKPRCTPFAPRTERRYGVTTTTPRASTATWSPRTSGRCAAASKRRPSCA